MDADRILSVYERIAGLMTCMVDAARAREWERLGRLETSCQAFIRTLKNTNLEVPMTAQLRKRRNRLIGEVLRADAQIRELTDPLATGLKSYLGGHGASRPQQRVAAKRAKHANSRNTKRNS